MCKVRYQFERNLKKKQNLSKYHTVKWRNYLLLTIYSVSNVIIIYLYQNTTVGGEQFSVRQFSTLDVSFPSLQNQYYLNGEWKMVKNKPQCFFSISSSRNGHECLYSSYKHSTGFYSMRTIYRDFNILSKCLFSSLMAPYSVPLSFSMSFLLSFHLLLLTRFLVLKRRNL